MLNESGLLQQLQQVAWSNVQPLCLYGDPAYPVQKNETNLPNEPAIGFA